MSTLHFTDAELACQCGCGRLPTQAFQDRLELELREPWRRPLHVNSGARCPLHNIHVSKTGPDGPHTIDATDFGMAGPSVHDFLVLAMVGPELWREWIKRGRPGFRGIGVHQRGEHAARFVHVDDIPDGMQPRPRVWTY